MVGTLLALIAATVWVPCVPEGPRQVKLIYDHEFSLAGAELGPSDYLVWTLSPGTHLHWRLLWRLDEVDDAAWDGPSPYLGVPASIHMPIAILVGASVMLAGGLLAWVIRRDRRRRAGVLL